jgi:cell shape-determining protein MreC
MIEELQEENEKLKDRLQISPQGDDKIDELEEAINHLRFQLTK